MSDPRTLAFLATGAAAIGRDGELPLRWREALRRLLGESFGTPRAWQFLELACARRVWPVWRARFPGEEQPIVLVSDAESDLEVSTTTITAQRLASTKTYLDNKFVLGEEALAAIYAGFSCLAAARGVIVGLEAHDTAESELDLEPESWHASYLASLALTGGAIWEESGANPSKRRQFWLWFLSDAVSDACRRAAGGVGNA